MEERKRNLQEMKICRFCFTTQDSELTSIYHREPKTVPLTIQIMSCMSIEVFPNDGFPRLICAVCKQQTLQSYTFKSNCRKSEEALKNYLLTGELRKPELQKIIKENRKRPVNEDIPTEEASVSKKKENMDVKRTKLDDGTEVITLCISHEGNSEQDQSSKETIPVSSEIGDVDLTEKENNFLVGVSENQPVKQVKTDVFSCNQCDKTFPLEQLLDLHIANYHRERNFSCSQCDSKFFTKYDLSKHENTHNPDKPHACAVCDKRFSRLSLMKRHENVHTETPRYMCMQCEKTFLSKNELSDHLREHSKLRTFTCDICQKSFVFKQGLVRHMASQHSGELPHKCNYCSAAFRSPISLTRHITTHAGHRPYPCKVCSRTFLLSHHLTRHMKSHFGIESTEGFGQHKCDICSMAFRRKDSLVNHSAIHSMVNLKCVICNTSFETAKLVKEHITTHLQGLPFPCEKCDYSFNTEQQLTEHEVKHAEMEYEEQIEWEVINNSDSQNSNNLECGICSATFQSKRTVKEHIKIHFENLQFSCKKCHFRFMTEEQLQEHEVKHAEDEEEEEEDVEEEGEISHFSIADFSDPTQLIPSKQQLEQNSEFMMSEFESNQEVVEELDDKTEFSHYFKSDLDQQEAAPKETLWMSDSEEHDDASSSNTIKPIYRVEGTKVYERKGPINRKIPEVKAQAQVQELPTVSLGDHNETLDTCTLPMDALTKLSDETPPVSMQMGNRTVKVQKFIISKDEMKQMAKMGILEMKNGKVIMKTPGKPILNAKMKPVQQSDIESLMFGKKQTRTQVRQYERRGQQEETLENQSRSPNKSVSDIFSMDFN